MEGFIQSFAGQVASCRKGQVQEAQLSLNGSFTIVEPLPFGKPSRNSFGELKLIQMPQVPRPRRPGGDSELRCRDLVSKTT